MDILFLANRDDELSRRACEFIRRSHTKVQAYFGRWDDEFPEGAAWAKPDIIVSYRSRWIVPATLLSHAKLAINFHPAPPNRPGFGGVNWALYENADTFGVTCHHMTARVDSGQIIAVRRFPISAVDTVETLCERTWSHLFALYCATVEPLLAGQPPPTVDTQWTGIKRTRADLAKLARISLDFSEAEISRRIRATTYREFCPVIEVKGERYSLLPAVPTSR